MLTTIIVVFLVGVTAGVAIARMIYVNRVFDRLSNLDEVTEAKIIQFPIREAGEER